MNQALSQETINASVVRGSGPITDNNSRAAGVFTITCIGADGEVRWAEEFKNLITDQGKRHLLDHGIGGPASAVTARMSLITSGTPVAGDTYATHAGFTELGSGVVAARGTPVFGAASGSGTVSKGASALNFSVIGTGTIIGCAINLVVGTVGNLGVVADTATAGAILYSAGTFTSKSVTSGDALSVTYSTSLA